MSPANDRPADITIVLKPVPLPPLPSRAADVFTVLRATGRGLFHAGAVGLGVLWRVVRGIGYVMALIPAFGLMFLEFMFVKLPRFLIGTVAFVIAIIAFLFLIQSIAQHLHVPALSHIIQ